MLRINTLHNFASAFKVHLLPTEEANMQLTAFGSVACTNALREPFEVLFLTAKGS